MALVTDYTTYEEIRSALGTNVDELPDATLALAMYAVSLQVELKQIGVALPATFATIKAIAPETNRSAAQQDVFEAVTMFAPYAVAMQLTGLPLFSPKEITDGKATVTRYSDSPYKLAIAGCKAEYERWKMYLAEKYKILVPSDATTNSPPPLFGVAAPVSDPVLGT
jgi:hypothetical protein